LTEALRVSEKVIISFPNFAHLRARVQIFFRGRTPVTSSLPYEWHDTPNLHFLSILDFIEYCQNRKITIKNSYSVGTNRRIKMFPNLFAMTGIFMISKS
jgi:methionine biosynthesis protein MetW